MTDEARSPHCDPLVLHAPGECAYCDAFPERQMKREFQGVNFTGHKDPGKTACPSEIQRPLKTINRWPGNRPAPADPGPSRQEWLEQLDRPLKEAVKAAFEELAGSVYRADRRFLLGCCMVSLKGRANPARVLELIDEALRGKDRP